MAFLNSSKLIGSMAFIMKEYGGSERANAREPVAVAVAFDDIPIPGADARRDGDDRKAPRQLGGARERGFGKSDYGSVKRLAQRRQAGIAEGRHHDGMVIAQIFGNA